MIDDSFYNGHIAPGIAPVLTNVPSVGTAKNQIPSTLFVDASYAVFESCAVQTLQQYGLPGIGNTPQTIPIRIDALNDNCDEIKITITVQSGASIMAGVSFDCYAKYSRTFASIDLRRQVWRFVIQGESIWLPSFGYGVEQPVCMDPLANAPHGAIYQGFIDYALETPDGSYDEDSAFWSARLSLTHHTGCYAHADVPAYNGHSMPFGGAYRHNDFSYHMVAPAAGFQWLSGTPANIAGRFATATFLRGETRSHEDPLHRTVNGPNYCLTEYGYFDDTYFDLATCNCASSTPLIYHRMKFVYPPGTPTPLPSPAPPTTSNAWVYDGTVGPPHPIYRAYVWEILGLTNGLQYPYWRLELGDWTSSTPWNGGVRLFAVGGNFYMGDLYNRGVVPPHIDNLENPHDTLQLIWGVTTDHLQQGATDVPSFIGNDIEYPTLLTDFANQLKHRGFYPASSLPLPPFPVPPQTHFGSPWVMSSLVWQISED